MPDVEFNRLFAQTYERLKRVGRRNRSTADGDTLCTTAVVHELYLRLATAEGASFQDSRRLLAYAAQAIRHMLVDAARRRAARGGAGAVNLELCGEEADALAMCSANALALDHALDRLQQDDERSAQVLELHYFAGLSIEQVAGVLELSTRSVDRDWRYARAFLRRAMGSGQ